MIRPLFSLVFLGGVVPLPASPTIKQPNVVILFSDDQGWADIGYNNPRVHTPRLDALARAGVTFAEHYAMPQCTPSRVALMTGRFPGRFGPQATQATTMPAFPPDTPTLASAFRQAGYETYLVGKWHLGSRLDHGPGQFGFDHSYGAMSGAVGMYDHRYRPGNYEQSWHRDGKIIAGYENGMHTTELLVREVERIVAAEHAKPFFLYVPFLAVHTPLDERGPFVDRPTQPDPANPRRWLDEDRIPWFNDPAGRIQAEPDPGKRLFLAAVHHLDAAVGQIVDALDRAGLRENTIIMFSSDNGPQVDWPGQAYPDDLRLTDFNQPLPMRGQKTDVWEGGIHVPGFVSWPGHFRPRVVTEAVHLVDWFPTLLSIIGFELPEAPLWDGVDLSGLLWCDEALPVRDLYWTWNENTNRWALRRGDWKIVHYGTDEPDAPDDWQLFNLRTDKMEERNVAAQHLEVVASLHARFLIQRARDAREIYVRP